MAPEWVHASVHALTQTEHVAPSHATLGPALAAQAKTICEFAHTLAAGSQSLACTETAAKVCFAGAVLTPAQIQSEAPSYPLAYFKTDPRGPPPITFL